MTSARTRALQRHAWLRRRVGLAVAQGEPARARLLALQASLGHQGSLGAFHAWHDALPGVHPYRTEAEVLQACEALNQRVAQRLPELFGRAPRARLAVRAEPELTRDTVSDHYQAPAADGPRPGIFFAVVHRPEDYLSTGKATAASRPTPKAGPCTPKPWATHWAGTTTPPPTWAICGTPWGPARPWPMRWAGPVAACRWRCWRPRSRPG